MYTTPPRSRSGWGTRSVGSSPLPTSSPLASYSYSHPHHYYHPPSTSPSFLSPSTSPTKMLERMGGDLPAADRLLLESLSVQEKAEEKRKEKELHGILEQEPIAHATVKWLRKRGYRVPQPPTTKENKLHVEFYERLFGIFDEDGSGEIDADELRSALEVVKVPPEHVEGFLALADANRSGSVDFQEFLEAAEKLEEAQEKANAAGEVSDAAIPWSLVAINYDSKKLLQEWGLPMISIKPGGGGGGMGMNESRKKLKAIFTVVKALRKLASDKKLIKDTVTMASPSTSPGELRSELTADDLDKMGISSTKSGAKKDGSGHAHSTVPPCSPARHRGVVEVEDKKSEYRAESIARKGRMLLSPFSAQKHNTRGGKGAGRGGGPPHPHALKPRSHSPPSPAKVGRSSTDRGRGGGQKEEKEHASSHRLLHSSSPSHLRVHTESSFSASASSPSNLTMSNSRYHSLMNIALRARSPILTSIVPDESRLSELGSESSLKRKDEEEMKRRRKERLRKAHGECRMGADMYKTETKPKIEKPDHHHSDIAAKKFKHVSSPIRDYIGSKQRGGDSEEMEGAKVEEGPSAMDFFRSPTSKAATPSSSHARGKALFSPSSSSKLRPSPHSASKGSSKTLPAGGLKAGRSGYDLISNDDGAFRADDFVGVLDSAHTPTASPPPLKSSLSIHANHLPTSSPATSVEVVEAEAAKVLSSQKKRLKAKAKRLRFDANTSSHTHWTRTKTPLTSISFATE
eukprot:CAMPEP_0113879038 /NCGR_PEP_ID=MMETSP0780_2-20120614/7014_1 /TAXON_ID=652834 /ORGANISM="Palpitomonas bilix" /LENGTH=743 /DNA_ID=CAMNT_0000865571 /DNA_START=343 /DNA_END=2574 /DNA_ORIENTATION=- /assembly_acc=CAM_ASM_000599